MKTLKQIILFITAFIVVLLISEVFISNTKIAELSFSDYYNDIGKGIAKPRTFTFLNEGFGIVHTNKSRYIGTNDVTLNKQANTIRVALIGDSFIESKQVFERHYFGTIAKKLLQEKFANKNIELLNFGRSNFNLGHMYAYKKLLIEKFNPDYILYFLSNDDLICDYSFPPLLPITTIKNNTLTTAINTNPIELNKYQQSKILTQHSTFLNILNSCRHLLKQENYTQQTLFGKFYSANNKHHNTTKPSKILDTITTEIIKNFDSKSIIINRDHINFPSYFNELCNQQNIKLWNLNDTLNNFNRQPLPLYFLDHNNSEGHWNIQGHKVVGTYIADKLSELITKEK